MTHYLNEIEARPAAWIRELMAAGAIPQGVVDGRSISDVAPDDVRRHRQCHFFAGVSGWCEALRLAGWADDRSCWTGSCPCQPFSAAGKGKGVADERHLWPQFFRLIRDCRPQVVFGEQVASADVVGTELEAAFVAAVQAGEFDRANRFAERIAERAGGAVDELAARWVDGVRADLARENYAFRFEVLGAHSVGSPHQRQRLYWVAWRAVDGVADVPSEGRGVKRSGEAGERQEDEPRRLRPACDGPGFWDDYALIPCTDGKTRRAESGVHPLAHGLPEHLVRVWREGGDGDPPPNTVPGRAALLKGYGNAIVPQVAAAFVRGFLRGEANGTL